MTDRPHASINKPVNTDKWRVFFTMAHSVLLENSDEAQAVAVLVNLAYAKGRTDIQRDLRSLLNVDRASE